MPLNKNNSLDYYGNDYPMCPHCDEVIDIDEHDLYYLYEEGDHTLECPNCEKEFTVISSAKYTFNTDEQEEA